MALIEQGRGQPISQRRGHQWEKSLWLAVSLSAQDEKKREEKGRWAFPCTVHDFTHLAKFLLILLLFIWHILDRKKGNWNKSCFVTTVAAGRRLQSSLCVRKQSFGEISRSSSPPVLWWRQLKHQLTCERWKQLKRQLKSKRWTFKQAWKSTSTLWRVNETVKCFCLLVEVNRLTVCEMCHIKQQHIFFFFVLMILIWL